MRSPIQHILLDIEGTTCPVSFVSEVLFPYALAALPAYLAKHQSDPVLQGLQQDLLHSWQAEQDPEAQELLKQERSRAAQGAEPPGALQQSPMLLPFLHWLNRRDIKLTAWKDLQGRIWREGYSSGALKASLFPEVADTLRRWHQQGYVLSVYSSGSVGAQQLLYGHSDDGDLTSLFSHWFDTRIGLKQEPQSYQRILDALSTAADKVLFISDSLAELQAASALGIHCWLSDRNACPDSVGDPDTSSGSTTSTTSSHCTESGVSGSFIPWALSGSSEQDNHDSHEFPVLRTLDELNPILNAPAS